MKKSLLLLASAALLLVGCAKEQTVGLTDNGETATVTVTAALPGAGQLSKAVLDNDGNAAKVNHWVMEVYDGDNSLFYKEEKKNVPAGTLTQTFTLKLFKNQTYTLLFWADTKGAYDTADLKNISVMGNVANKDSRDAFSAVVENYTSEVSESTTVTLYRPFGQLNIITTDLEDMKEQVLKDAYMKYAPIDLELTATIPTTFNVWTQKAGETSEQTLTADASYAKFKAGAPETTLFMDYIFASKDEADIVDFTFKFKSNNNAISYDFKSIPIRRNYRTNIKGQLMSNDSEWTVIIDPIWETPDIVPVVSIQLDRTEMTLFVEETRTLTATALPEDATQDKGVTWSSSNEEVATVDESGKVTAVAIGTATITATSNADGLKTAACTVTVDHNFVEMAGLKWATCNIGAEAPTEAGWYFSWGNTDGYVNNGPRWVKASGDATLGSDGKFSIANYTGTPGASLTGDITPDGGHDAARVNWAMDWRMPTAAEFQKLYEACGGEGVDTVPEALLTSTPEKGIYWLASNQEFITAYTGVAGLLFVDESKIQLFFPVTGYGNGTTTLKGPTSGRYWASSLNYPEPDSKRTAYKLYFTSSSVCPQYATTQCYRGYPIRPVKDISK